jgi:hypothetical protein
VKHRLSAAVLSDVRFPALVVQGACLLASHQPVPVQPTGTVQHPNFAPTARGSPAVQAALGIYADDPFKVSRQFVFAVSGLFAIR